MISSILLLSLGLLLLAAVLVLSKLPQHFFFIGTLMQGQKAALRERFAAVVRRPRMTVSVALLLLAVMLLATACFFGGEDAAPVPPAESMPERQITDEEIAELFRQAEAAYAWFSGHNSLPLGTEAIELKGGSYFPVADPRFASLSQLRDYLNTLFEAQLTEQLLATTVGDGLPLLTEVDNSLYMFGGYAALLPYDIGQWQLYRADRYDDIIAVQVELTADPYGQLSYRLRPGSQLRWDPERGWRFSDFELPLEQLLEATAFTLHISGQPALALGLQNDRFPIEPLGFSSSDMTPLAATDIPGATFYAVELPSSVAACRNQLIYYTIAESADIYLQSLSTDDPNARCFSGVGPGSSEVELLAAYPQRLTDITAVLDAEHNDFDRAYHYASASFAPPEREITFYLRDGAVLRLTMNIILY